MSSQGKIAIIGAGHVGSHCALSLAHSGARREVVLIDKDAPKARAQALDVSDSLSFTPAVTIVRDGTYQDCADADIVVIAIGEARLPGQTRLDMLENSIRMLHGLLGALKPLAIKGLVITITNPADIIANYVRLGLGLPRNRVFGTGTLLDSARLIRLLSEATGYSRSDVHAVSMGEHGDSSMVPFSQVTIGNKPFSVFKNLDRSALLSQTRQGGMDIVEGKGSTEFGIGQVLSVLCGSILRNEHRILPLSVLLEGEYGQHGLHAGVPCRVGRDGIEEVIELELDAGELSQLHASFEVITAHNKKAQELAPTDSIGNPEHGNRRHI